MVLQNATSLISSIYGVEYLLHGSLVSLLNTHSFCHLLLNLLPFSSSSSPLNLTMKNSSPSSTATGRWFFPTVVILLMAAANTLALQHSLSTPTNYLKILNHQPLLSNSLPFPLSPPRLHHPPPPSDEIDPRYGVEKRLVPSGPNPLHN